MSILINKDDYERLRELIAKYGALPVCGKKEKEKAFVSLLHKKLKKAKILEISVLRLLDVVALNTSVRFKNLSTKEVKEYLIVHPKIECLSLGRLSVLSDLGVALIGHKKGEIVKVKNINGTDYKVQILDVQPTSQEWIKRHEMQC